MVIYGGFGEVVGAGLWVEKSWLYGCGCGKVGTEIVEVMFMHSKKCVAPKNCNYSINFTLTPVIQLF